MHNRNERAHTLIRLAQHLHHSAEATPTAEPPHSPWELADKLDTLAAMLHTIQAELAAMAETIGSMNTAGQARDTETVRTPDHEHQTITLTSADPLDHNTGTVSYAVSLDGDPIGFVGDSYEPDGRRWFAVASITGDPATVAAAMWDSGPAYRTRAAAIDALTRHVQQFRRQQ